MHRSGSSLVANWLNECGLDIGKRLYKASKHNKKGYYEDCDFLELHEKLLKNNNIHSSGLKGKVKPPILSYKEIDDLKKIIKTKTKNQWGWKEPRTTLFIDYYASLMPHAYHLILFREPVSVISSLIKRQFNLGKKYSWSLLNVMRTVYDYLIIVFFTDHYAKIWITYYDKILHSNINKDKSIFLSYKDIIKKDKKIINLLTKWGFDLDEIPFSSVYDSTLISKPIPVKRFISSKSMRKIKSIEEAFKTLNTTYE